MAMVALMEESGLGCFRGGNALPNLRERFKSALLPAQRGFALGPERAATLYASYLVYRNARNIRTRLYDWIQWRQNAIPYSP